MDIYILIGMLSVLACILIYLVVGIITIFVGRLGTKEVYEYPEELKDRTMEERLKRHDELVKKFEETVDGRSV